MLTRPIGIVLPLLAVAGLSLGRGASRRRAFERAATCLIATSLVVVPWLVRNARVSGRLAISHQSGVSLAYFKVVDVLLWERGMTAARFDPEALRPLYDEIDRRLLERWERENGPVGADQAADLRHTNLIYGNMRHLNAVDVSRTLWRISVEMLAQRPGAATECYAARAMSMLAFPLSIAVWPPANEGSMPFAASIGAGHASLARVLAAAVGGAFALLVGAASLRVAAALWRRERFGAWFAVVAAAGLIAMTIPFEDPRFREPIVPALLLIALWRQHHADGPETEISPVSIT
jgi:hypothetical protein